MTKCVPILQWFARKTFRRLRKGITSVTAVAGHVERVACNVQPRHSVAQSDSLKAVLYAFETALCYAVASSSDEEESMGTRPGQQLLLASVQNAKNRLQYLSHNDWMLLVDRAKQVTFKKGDVLIQQGSQAKMLYVIADGKVKVSILGKGLGQIGPGEVCGEMAFLEDTSPSATATAEEEVQAFAIDWKSLIELFELFPHLGSRFYRSLAVNLSRRLREQIIQKKT